MPLTQVPSPMLAPGTAGNGPAFSAYRGGAGQVISANTVTKLQIDSELFDTNNNYDPSTNYRFTPTVAGYYQVSATASLAGSFTSALGFGNLYLYKNGSPYQYSGLQPSNNNYLLVPLASLVYLNGSTDYIELYAISNVGITLVSGSTWTFFNAALVRAA